MMRLRRPSVIAPRSLLAWAAVDSAEGGSQGSRLWI